MGCLQPGGRAFPGLFLLFCSAPSHFSDHLMLHQSATRSHISVTSLLSGEVCCSNCEASLFCRTGATEWILALYILCAGLLWVLFAHLSSHYPHTEIWRHLSQLEAHLLFLQQLSLVQQHTASATRTQMMLSVTWAFFQNPKQQNGSSSQLKLKGTLKVSEMARSLRTCWWDITTYFKLLSFRI